MQTSEAGLQAIKNEESLRLQLYPDQVGVLTIGWGHTGPDVVPGLVWTNQQAQRAFALDVVDKETALNGALGVRVTQWEYDALVSLAFNEGAAAIAGSTLVRQLNSGVKAPDVALHFLDWIYVTEHGVKRISKGHVARRGREMLRFLGHMEPH